MGVLKKEQEALLREERRIINDLQMALVKFGGESEDEESLRHSIQQLDELFLLVVVGEFNSGKSAVINALLGQKVLEEGVIPTTTQIHQIRHGKAPEKTILGDGQTVLTFPIEFLSEMTIVDTPAQMPSFGSMRRLPRISFLVLTLFSLLPRRIVLSRRVSELFWNTFGIGGRK